jgi:hypothetical protein
MGKRQFITVVLLTAFFLAAANVAIYIVSGHSPARRQIDLIEHSSGSNCIVLGNSLLRNGFNPAVFDNAAASMNVPARSLNAAVGATYPVEHLLLLRLALRTNPHPSVVVYGFFDFQLSDPPVVRSDELMGNRNIGVFLEPQVARRFYVMDLATAVTFRLLHDVPMYVERGNPYTRVELLRRRLRRIGLGASVVDASGNHDFAELEAADSDSFSRHCREVVENDDPLSAPIEEIIRESLSSGGRVVFVEMPLPPTHVRDFYDLPAWGAYAAYVRGLVTEEGAEFLDASRWMPDTNDFVDRLHMNDTAAAKFSAKLAEAIYDRAEEPAR